MNSEITFLDTILVAIAILIIFALLACANAKFNRQPELCYESVDGVVVCPSHLKPKEDKK